MADQEIAELKELVRQNIALSQETNKMLHHMRASERMRSLMWWLFVLISVGLSVWSYFTFVAPRIEQIMGFYNQNAGQAQSIWENVGNFFKNMPGATTTQ